MKIIPRIFRPLPRLLYLEPVFGCNYRCFFCIHGSSAPPVKPVKLSPAVFERLKPIIDKVAHVHITGLGEPFLNEHLGDYLAYFRDTGKKIYINTNGSLIQEAHLQLLLSASCELSISLDAGDQRTYEKMRRPGSWKQVIDTLRRISRLRSGQADSSLSLYLTYHINRLNLPSLLHLPDLCGELGIDAVKLSWTLLPETHGELSPFDLLPGAAGMIREVSATLRSRGIAVRDEVLFEPHTRGCWNLTGFTFIGATGMVAACCNRWLSIGDLSKNSFKDIWNGEPHRRILFGVLNRRPVAPCKTCRQLRSVDYLKNPNAFLKSDAADRTLLSEKRRTRETLPVLSGLAQAFAAGFDALTHGNADGATAIYGSLLRDYPGYYEIRNNLAAAHWLGGRPEKSAEVLAPVASLAHNHGIFRYNLDFLRPHAPGIGSYGAQGT